VQRRPEAVAGTREVVAGRSRVQAGIDSDEQDLQGWSDDIAQAFACGSLELGPTGPA